MPITLSITDNGNGTGAVATIGGGQPTATNIVYTAPVPGVLGSVTWTNSGNRVGNGTVALSLAKGYYWAHVSNTLVLADTITEVSNLVYFAVTDATEAVHERCLDAVQARIQGLALSGIPSAQVYVRKVPWTRETTFPCVQIAPIGAEKIPRAGGTNLRDDIEYPVLVVIVDKDDQKQQTNRDRDLLWRQRIIKAFRNQRLPGVSEVHQCVVEPQAINPPKDWIEQSAWVSAVRFNFVTREARGIS